MSEHLQRTEKILSRINELASISEDPNCITRTLGSDAFRQAGNKLLSWMNEAGLEARIDNIGNVRGKLPSNKSSASTFVIASHFDTVMNAGRFDGPLGVIMGLDLVEHIIRSKMQLPFHIELIAFSDEEGVRFHSTYLGSKVVAGRSDTEILNRKDASGVTVSEVIRAMGGDTGMLVKDAIAKDNWLGYFEIHIEQGPVLYENDVPVAIVKAIAGQKRSQIRFKGMSGHAGTVPMNMRRDALCCASEFILETEKLALIHKDVLVATVGKLDIVYPASNVIPGEVVCTLDLRSANETLLATCYESLQKVCKAVCNKRNIAFEWNLVQRNEPVACDKKMNGLLKEAIEDANHQVITLVSGAGHDAVAISEVAPVCMLFVRCFKGISHNPLENVEPKDIAAAVEISEKFIHNLVKNNDRK